MEHTLFAGIGLDERDLFLAAAGEPKVAQALLVDRENAASSAVFGRHIRNGRAIREWKILQSGTEVFDELAHHSMLAQHLGDGEDEIGRSRAFAQAARSEERRVGKECR